MIIILATIAGFGLGYIIERGNMCFHSTIRGLLRQPRQLDLLRAYLLILLVTTPLVWGLRWLGVVEPWVAPFAWQANLSGGVIFGVGMVVASTCITGLFYKLGHGMLGTLVALFTWAIGDIITYRGPLAGWRESLNQGAMAVDGQSATLINLLGLAGLILILSVGGGIAIWLWRSPRRTDGKRWNWLHLGLAAGLFISLAWVLADWGGANYPYGTASIPTSVYLVLTEGGSLWSPWITYALVSLILGSFVAAKLTDTLWIRGETRQRNLQLALGGFLMGVGSAIAGGCNLGHSLIGVPLLSVGSITTTLSMVVGVGIAHYVAKWVVTSSL